MTPLDIRTMIRDQITDPSENFWTEAEIYRYMSLGAREMILKFPELGESTTTVTATIGTANYSYTSTNPISISEIGYIRPGNSVSGNYAAEVYDKLKKIDRVDQYYLLGDSTQTGYPEYYREGNSPSTFYSVPAPDGTGTFVVRFFEQDPTLTASSTFNTSLEPYSHYLLDYCLYRMFMKDPELGAQGEAAGRLWVQHLKDLEEQLAFKAGRDRHYVVRDEDLYPYTDLGIR